MTDLKGGNFDKFIVIKRSDVYKGLGNVGRNRFMEMCETIEKRRRIGNDKPPYRYLVINTDEPYADEVIEILKKNGHWG